MLTTHSNATIASRLVAFLLPLMLTAYWPYYETGLNVHHGAILIRVMVLAGVALAALIWNGNAYSPEELKWAAIVAAWMCLLLIATALAGNVTRGLHNWVRVLPVYCVVIVLAKPLRHAGTRQALGLGMHVGSVASGLFILAIYLRYAGFNLPTYEHLRELKSLVQASSGVALNPLAYATLLFSCLSLCVRRSGWGQRIIAVLIAILGSVLTGSRAPLALAVGCIIAVYLTNLLRNCSVAVRIAICCVICCCLFGAVMIGLHFLHPRQLSAVTEGRYDLWMVGVEKFLDRPLAGYGPESWRDDALSHLPGYYKGTHELMSMRAGGYHSEFVTLLAEGGLVCFIPAMIIFCILFKSCCSIAYHPSTPRFNGQALLFTFFLFLFRATVEVPGIFGYGEDVVDFLGAIFIALVVAQTSLLKQRRPVAPVLSFDAECVA